MSAPNPTEPTARPKLTRRTFVLDRGFQLRYTALLAVVGAVSSGVFGLLVVWLTREARRATALTPALEAELASHDGTLLALMAALTVLMAAALSVFGVLLTHRVAGPVYVMSHYVAILARGRYPLMRPLRKGDELKHLFEGLQGALESLRQREAAEATLLDEALSSFTPLASGGEARELLEKLAAVRDRKRDATDRFEVGRVREGKSAA